MSDARDMAYRSPPAIPKDLRTRLEAARLDLLALFRTLDRMNLSAGEIPQRLLQQLFELDADYAEALWALDQPAGSLDRHATHLEDTASSDSVQLTSQKWRHSTSPHNKCPICWPPEKPSRNLLKIALY
jgi:hypothetical protein